MINHSHSTNENTFPSLKDNLCKKIADYWLQTSCVGKKKWWRWYLHITPKKRPLALTQGDGLQGDKVIYFSNLLSFKFLSSLARSLQVIFSGPNSYHSFNLSRALCNCMPWFWVELFLFYNWALHAEKPQGHHQRFTARKMWM